MRHWRSAPCQTMLECGTFSFRTKDKVIMYSMTTDKTLNKVCECQHAPAQNEEYAFFNYCMHNCLLCDSPLCATKTICPMPNLISIRCCSTFHAFYRKANLSIPTAWCVDFPISVFRVISLLVRIYSDCSPILH